MFIVFHKHKKKARHDFWAVLVEAFSRGFQSRLSVAPHSQDLPPEAFSRSFSPPIEAAMPRGKDNEKTELCILHSAGGVAAVSILP